MKNKIVECFILSMTLLFSTNASPDSDRSGTYPDKVITKLLPEKPSTEVTVVKLLATGEDDFQSVLFNDPAGLEITMDMPGKAGEYVQSKGLVDGVYHTLIVELSHHYKG